MLTFENETKPLLLL